jgi:hypothetical protein
MADYGVANMWFCISIILAVTMLFLAYARWRWRSKLIHRILSGRTTFELQNNAIEKMQGSKYLRLLVIVLSHIGVYFFLLLLYWRYIIPNPYGNPELYFSSKVRHVILLCMVIIVFPLVSIILEIARRKAERKKHND